MHCLPLSLVQCCGSAELWGSSQLSQLARGELLELPEAPAAGLGSQNTRGCRRPRLPRWALGTRFPGCRRSRSLCSHLEACGGAVSLHDELSVCFLVFREPQGIIACCNPVPPLVRQQLNEIHLLIQQAREMPLLKVGNFAAEGSSPADLLCLLAPIVSPIRDLVSIL